MLENHRKSLIQHCERSELRWHFEGTKVNYKWQKWSNLASFWKPEACGQTVLPDKSVLKGQKLVENANMKILNATFWVIFKQCSFTLCKVTSKILFILGIDSSIGASSSCSSSATKRTAVVESGFPRLDARKGTGLKVTGTQQETPSKRTKKTDKAKLLRTVIIRKLASA